MYFVQVSGSTSRVYGYGVSIYILQRFSGLGSASGNDTPWSLPTAAGQRVATWSERTKQKEKLHILIFPLTKKVSCL